MRVALFLLAVVTMLAACAESGMVAGCAGFQPGSEGWQACRDANGVAIATGPGSPYAYRNLED